MCASHSHTKGHIVGPIGEMEAILKLRWAQLTIFALMAPTFTRTERETEGKWVHVSIFSIASRFVSMCHPIFTSVLSSSSQSSPNFCARVCLCVWVEWMNSQMRCVTGGGGGNGKCWCAWVRVCVCMCEPQYPRRHSKLRGVEEEVKWHTAVATTVPLNLGPRGRSGRERGRERDRRRGREGSANI